MARASVVFPDPDSPTSARHSRSWSCERDAVQDLAGAVERVHARSPRAARRRPAAHRRAGSVVIAEGPISATRMQRAPWAGPELDERRWLGRARRSARRRSAARTRSRRGGRPGGGTRPGIASSSRRLAMSGIAPISLRVYGCAGASKSSLVGPPSTMRPAYITSTRCGQRRDGGEVVADVDGGRLVAPAELANRREHVRLRRDVEPGRRLVEDDQGGPQEERDRQADALLLAAGELVRIAPQEHRRSPAAGPRRAPPGCARGRRPARRARS